jgi:hypothetical protein
VAGVLCAAAAWLASPAHAQTQPPPDFSKVEVKAQKIAETAGHGGAVSILTGPDGIVVGDVLRAHEYPSIGRPDGGTLAGMLRGLDALVAMAGPNTRFVTSHGQVVDRTAVVDQRTLLLTSRDRIAALMKAGQESERDSRGQGDRGFGRPGPAGPHLG